MKILPFSFSVNGEILFGIRHEPIVNKFPDWCVVILAGPGTNRCGPHRLHIDISQMFCSDGLRTYRFDYRGRGESAGDPLRLTVYTMIEDIIGMISYLRNQFPDIKNCLLIANCLSCVSALKYFESDNFVKSCVLLGAQELHDKPIIFTYLQEFYGVLTKYAGKATRLLTWKKILRRSINVRQVGASFTNAFPDRFKTTDPSEKRKVTFFLKNFGEKKPSHKSVYFIYGSKDPFKKELNFYERYARQNAWNFHSTIIKNADRTFTDKSTANDLIAHIQNYKRQIINKTTNSLNGV